MTAIIDTAMPLGRNPQLPLKSPSIIHKAHKPKIKHSKTASHHASTVPYGIEVKGMTTRRTTKIDISKTRDQRDRCVNLIDVSFRTEPKEVDLRVSSTFFTIFKISEGNQLVRVNFTGRR
jgi:hypothetical protein